MNPRENEKYDLALVQSTLADDFGMRVDGLARLDPEEIGDSSQVFSAQLEGQRIIIKTIENDHGTYPVEIVSLELLRKHGIPVATPLGHREKVKYLDQPMVIQTALTGFPLDHLEKPEKLLALTEEAGKILRKIHKIKLEGFGKLEIRNGQLHGQSSSWKNSLLEYNPNGVGFNDTAYLVDNGFISPDEAKKIERVFAQILEVDLPQAAFVHNDFHKYHLFTDGEQITGVIDMGAVSAGDPRFDLAKSHFYLSKEERAAFDQGYGELASDPLVARYSLLVAGRKVIYRHSKNFLDRIPEAVRRLKQSLEEIK
jgi:aminoglycoside phosphotransferase (APT) family kinase protein